VIKITRVTKSISGPINKLPTGGRQEKFSRNGWKEPGDVGGGDCFRTIPLLKKGVVSPRHCLGRVEKWQKCGDREI